MAAHDYVQAHEDFRIATTYLPDAVVSGKSHDEAVAGFCESGIKLAETHRRKANTPKPKRFAGSC